MPCPSSCGDFTLLGNPEASCTVDIRQKSPSRFFYYPCNVTLPDPITPENIAPLFEDGTIVASSELANFTVNDPATDDVVISDCRPALPVVSSREIIAEDRIRVELTSGSPATTNMYFDYDFWQDKTEHQFQMNAMIAYCDGDVIIPVDINGNPLTFTMLAYLNWQRPATQGGASIEFKRITMRFQGDPFALHIKPSFNWITAGITL